MPEKKMPLSEHHGLAAGDSDKGIGNAVKHGDRIAALGACKQRSREMAKHLRDNGTTPRHEKLHAEISNCANYLVFNHYYTKNEIRLAKARTCKKHMLCPFCARARGAKLVEKQLERAGQVMADNPKLIPAMLTLTVKNGPDLMERFEHLIGAFRTLQSRRRDWFKKGRGYTEFAKINGAVFSVEFTNKGNGWHPHLHAFVLLDDYIDQAALSAEWERITGDSSVVDIRKVKATKSGTLADAMTEVFKYAVKFSDLSLDLNLEAYETLLGKRLLGSFGSLHGVKVPEKLTDDLLTDLPYIEMFYKFAPKKRAYSLTHTKKHDYDPRNDDDGTQLEISRYEPFRRDQSNGHPQRDSHARSAGLPQCSDCRGHLRHAGRPDQPSPPSFTEADFPY